MEKKNGIKLHEESLSHLDSKLKWSGYKGSLPTGSIEVIVRALRVQAVRDNRHYIKTVGQVTTHCAVQDLPLRGHREGRLVDDMDEIIDSEFNCGSRNSGKFLEILTAFGVHDKVVKEKLNGRRNAQYVYEGVSHEDFFNFIIAEGVDANSIMENLSHVLAVMGVCSRDHMVAQCNDGVSTMSGRLHGLQALMRSKVCPMVLYVDCWAHRLNFVVVACCRNIDKAVSFFASIQKLYTFLSISVPHDFFEKT
ncbi:Zinc finger MYM-type protein 1-like [Oopsacas minuta]|uniref:Zinc finger MYM-type protein 1-like n=1 Tax=Oopsacas minuta TaxID=111878 RepID=A0AAV7K7J4_9METZ|nr:Zinc finger MYM-type protein 1-like [Oopsacas minuta]